MFIHEVSLIILFSFNSITTLIELNASTIHLRSFRYTLKHIKVTKIFNLTNSWKYFEIRYWMQMFYLMENIMWTCNYETHDRIVDRSLCSPSQIEIILHKILRNKFIRNKFLLNVMQYNIGGCTCAVRRVVLYVAVIHSLHFQEKRCMRVNYALFVLSLPTIPIKHFCFSCRTPHLQYSRDKISNN